MIASLPNILKQNKNTENAICHLFYHKKESLKIIDHITYALISEHTTIISIR